MSHEFMQIGDRSLPVVVGDPSDEHAIVMRGGTYECVGCDMSTLNVWMAEHHYEEHHGEMEDTDKPDWL